MTIRLVERRQHAQYRSAFFQCIVVLLVSLFGFRNKASSCRKIKSRHSGGTSGASSLCLSCVCGLVCDDGRIKRRENGCSLGGTYYNALSRVCRPIDLTCWVRCAQHCYDSFGTFMMLRKGKKRTNHGKLHIVLPTITTTTPP
jgi:hypothetical protein